MCRNEGIEIKYASISVTDELREMNDKIIDCHKVDGQWVFKRLRHDRCSPNGRKTVKGRQRY